jgi:hypothetical protein
MKKVLLTGITLVALGSFYKCTSGQMDTPESTDGLLLAQGEEDEVLRFKDSADGLHEVATGDLLTNRSYASKAAAQADGIAVGQLYLIIGGMGAVICVMDL